MSEIERWAKIAAMNGRDWVPRDEADAIAALGRDRHARLETCRQQLEGAVGRIAEADRLLRVAYASTHPEDVPVDVLRWLNPDPPGGGRR